GCTYPTAPVQLARAPLAIDTVAYHSLSLSLQGVTFECSNNKYDVGLQTPMPLRYSISDTVKRPIVIIYSDTGANTSVGDTINISYYRNSKRLTARIIRNDTTI